jgi:leucyl-tRNA synthetase
MWENLGLPPRAARWPARAVAGVRRQQDHRRERGDGRAGATASCKGTVTVPMDSDEKTVVDEALKLEKVAKLCEGKQIVKTILVKNKLVNLIVK